MIPHLLNYILKIRPALVAGSLLWGGSCMAATSDWKFDGPQLKKHGITLAAIPLPDSFKLDIPAPDAPGGLRILAAALDVLVDNSPFATDALNTLKRNGRVIILYDPAFPEKTLGDYKIAAFKPTYFKKQRKDGHKGEFIAVIGRYGIKWTPREIAGVIGHELLGHGLQFLRRRQGSMRELERECEARLYQERVNQDVGVNKLSRMSVAARKSMENKYCAGFKRFMSRTSPSMMRLWDEINPDVPRLLKLFESYLLELARGGVTRRAVNAGKQSRVKFLESAALDGDATAQYQLGMLYTHGDILEKDLGFAAKWIENAAQQGHLKAQNRFGVIHEYGHGRPKDDLRAIHWYRKAAERNLPEAETNLGHMHERGRGVKRDRVEALKWYRRAANRGFARAQHNLAIMYDKGRGITRDPSLALTWLRRAAGQYYAPSETSLGYAYQTGRGIGQDNATAAKWYRRAAERGHETAQYLLARLYDQGHGVARDPARAYFWYGLSLKNGKGKMASRANDARKRLVGGIGKTQSGQIDARIHAWRPVGGK